MMKQLIGIAVAAIALVWMAGSTQRAAAQTASDMVKQIDADCQSIQNATMALHPVHLALVSGNWRVFSEGDYAVVEQTHKSIAFADVWKQGANPAWVTGHSFNANGDQRAAQLCFRQADGTLERAKQAGTAPDLDAASAEVAYFANDGSVIQKTSLFEVDDPAISKKVSDLPFYSVLP
jgi:hypothetical protein